MPLEPTFNFIDDLDSTNPNNSPDQVKEAANHLRGTKQAVQGSFPNLGQTAVTRTAVDINDLATKNGTEVVENKTINNGTFTGTQTGFTGDISGAATTANSVTGAGVITNANLATDSVTAGKIAANAVGASEIAANAVGASEIAASAVGTSEIADRSIQYNDMDYSSVRVSEHWFRVTLDQTRTTTSSLTLERGIYNIYTNNDRSLVQIHTGTNGWKTVLNSVDGQIQLVSDGANVRFVSEFGAVQSFYYRRIF